MKPDVLIDPVQLGARIKELRKQNHLTQAQLCAGFITVRTLQKIEKGEIIPSFEVLLHVANQFKLDLFDLILSSRLPYYFDHYFERIVRMLQDPNLQLDAQKSFSLLSTLRSFTEIKLPYNQAQKLELSTALALAFLLEHHHESLIIRENYIANIDFDELPDELDYLALAGAIRLQEDETKANALMLKLSYYPMYGLHPSVVFACNQRQIKAGLFSEIIERTKQCTGRFHEPALQIAFLYGQCALAAHELQQTEAEEYVQNSRKLLELLGYDEEYLILLKQYQIAGLIPSQGK